RSSERRLVVTGGGLAPRGPTRRLGRCAAAPRRGGSRLLLPEPGAGLTAAALAGDTGDLRGGVAQRRADLLDDHLDARAAAAVLALVLTDLQRTGHDDAGALGQRAGDVLGQLAPGRAADEQRVAVLPLVRLAIERASGGR